MLARSNAIVLRRLRYSDTSLIVTVLTHDRGIESMLAKGARSPKNRLSSVLQPLEEIEVQYYVKPGRELHLVRSAERQSIRHRLGVSYEHTLAALQIVELVLRLELPNRPAAEVFMLLSQILCALDAAQERVGNFVLAFAVRYAALHGFHLQLDTDAVTKQPLTIDSLQRYGFALPAGMPFRLNLTNMRHEGTVSGMALLMLADLIQVPLEKLSSLELDDTQFAECYDLLWRYLEYHFERRLPEFSLTYAKSP